MNDDIEILLSDPQTEVLASRASIILDMAGQGGGKSRNIGYSSGMMVADFPQALGFIGANTNLQLSQSTLARTFETWRETFGYTEYDQKMNPAGSYVVDKKPPPHFKRIHWMRSYDGSISFYNGAFIFLGSLENYQAHDGKEFAWAHLDETKDTKEKALKEVILGRLRQYGMFFHPDNGDILFNPRLTADQAREMGLKAWNPLYIHTSPSLSGVPWLNKMFKLDKFEQKIKEEVLKEEKGFFNARFENKHVIIYPTHHNAHNLPPNYIENQKSNLEDEDKIMKLVYGWPFSKGGGEYFPSFTREKHIQAVPFINGLSVHTSWDFNVVPYMTMLALQLQFLTRYIDPVGVKHDAPKPGFKAVDVMRIRVYREYCLKSPHNTTEAVCEHFEADHDSNATDIYYYGDASGLNRIPGLGSQTNFKIISDKLYLFIHNDSKKVKGANISPLKRRDMVNKVLADKIPGVELVIDASCVELINDMENVKLGPKGKVKKREKNEATGEQEEKVGHTSDCLEYIVCEIVKPYFTN